MKKSDFTSWTLLQVCVVIGVFHLIALVVFLVFQHVAYWMQVHREPLPSPPEVRADSTLMKEARAAAVAAAVPPRGPKETKSKNAKRKGGR